MESNLVTIRDYDWYGEWTMTFDLDAIAGAIGKRDEEGRLLITKPAVRRILELIRRLGSPEEIAKAERMLKV